MGHLDDTCWTFYERYELYVLEKMNFVSKIWCEPFGWLGIFVQARRLGE